MDGMDAAAPARECEPDRRAGGGPQPHARRRWRDPQRVARPADSHVGRVAVFPQSMRVIAVTVASVVLGARLSAHTAEPRGLTAPGALSLWDLAVIALLTVSGLLYVRGVVRMQQRGAFQPLRERMAFGCGWTVLVLTVMPPIDALAIELFSVHMVQHEMMML